MASIKDIKANIKVDTTDIPMSDEVKNEWVNDPLNKTLDKWLSSGPSEMRLINLEDKHMRILKGWTKDERKELKEFKEILYINGLLHIWEKYDKAETGERISIIRDILDFYTGKAKFPE